MSHRNAVGHTRAGTAESDADPERRGSNVLAEAPWRVYGPLSGGIPAVGRHLRELWRYRVLLEVLVRRDLKARYRGSVLGYSWTLLNPLMLLGVYSLVFSVYMRVNLPDYPLYMLSALLPWMWLAQALSTGSSSLVEGSMLVSKVMLPPQLPPIVDALANGVHFLFALPVLLVFAVWSGRPPGVEVLWLVPIIVGQAVFLAGLTLPLAGLCVLYRDIKFLVSNGIQFWFFLTPIVYPPSLIPARYRVVLNVNPFVPFSNAYQDVLYRGVSPSGGTLLSILLVSIASLILGVLLFEYVREGMVEEL